MSENEWKLAGEFKASALNDEDTSKVMKVIEDAMKAAGIEKENTPNE